MPKPSRTHPWRTNMVGRGASPGTRAGRRPQHKKPDACEACGLVATVHKGLVFDHDHGTGQHRGWLCGGCNSALGMAGDNPEVLEALAAYLRRTTCTPTRPAALPSQSTCPAPAATLRQANHSDAVCQGVPN